ncbi:MAG: hypothetical protein JW878_07840 [Methanomicrobia archaeon]|nr:hypothetical protein [Methanomicrobia archaeon]
MTSPRYFSPLLIQSPFNLIVNGLCRIETSLRFLITRSSRLIFTFFQLVFLAFLEQYPVFLSLEEIILLSTEEFFVGIV